MKYSVVQVFGDIYCCPRGSGERKGEGLCEKRVGSIKSAEDPNEERVILIGLLQDWTPIFPLMEWLRDLFQPSHGEVNTNVRFSVAV